MPVRALGIVGMRRSGTSSISLALNRLGVSFGPENQLYGGDSFNQEGYWEHKRLTTLQRLFRSSLSLRSVETDPLPEDWRDYPATEHFLEKVVACLDADFVPLPCAWAWKDPDASLALPFVYEANKRAGIDPHILICVRNPLDVARSEQRRKGVPELETVGSWLAHTLGALGDSQSHNRTIIVFSEFLKDPRKALSATVSALGLTPSDSQWLDALSSVRSELSHSNSDLNSLVNYPPLVKQVYELCLRATAGIDASTEKQISGFAHEFDSFRQMMFRPQLEEATLGAAWERKGESQTTDEQYRPSPGWKKLSLEVKALPGSIIKLSFYPLPALVWIRKAAWRQNGEAPLMAGRSGTLHEKFGIHCISLLPGPDQVLVRTPSTKGPFILDLEFMVETSILVSGETFMTLSKAARS